MTTPCLDAPRAVQAVHRGEDVSSNPHPQMQAPRDDPIDPHAEEVLVDEAVRASNKGPFRITVNDLVEMTILTR